MTPERWKQIRAVFEEAEALQMPLRLAFLNQACAGDDELHREVGSLLEAGSEAGSDFMGRPAADLMHSFANVTAGAAFRIGTRVGPYQIVDEIGHGGMGEVYRAARIDGQFDQQVAIKLVRVGLGSAFIIKRFLGERQILATLNHPNIARLLDGGATEDGVPYLVMELIEGDRIDLYCQAKRLSVSARLGIFLQLCDALQYAHQRLVIHRDIKPGNILVTKDGSPKLLDFGIAKILDPSGDSEITMARPMTPEFASPEQVRGEPITTASDVYSLGVILYQLLTGRSPYRISNKSPAQLSQAITGTDPQRPSTAVMSPALPEQVATPGSGAHAILSEREPTPARLHKRLSGDLDSILLMALRKEPERRYGSVQQFAEDINRHLNGLPVSATGGSWSYTARKFVARHRAGVTATALVMLALVAGIAATERQARIARRERERAQMRFDDVRQFSNSLIFDINDALQDVPGTTPARKLLLDRASHYLDRVAKDATGDSGLQRELAFAYQRLATVQGDSTVSNVGEISAAEQSSQKATALFEAVAKANPNDTVDQLNVASIHREKGFSDIYYPAGRPEIEKALAITERLMRTDGKNPKVQMERAIEFQALASSLDIWGERQSSADMFRKSLQLVESVARVDPAYNRIRERLAKTHVLLGFQLSRTAELAEAEKQMKDGIEQYAEMFGKGGQPDSIRDLAQSRFRLGFVQGLSGHLDSAAANFLLSRDAEAPLAKADPQNMMLRMDMTTFTFESLRIAVLKGHYREAEAPLAQMIADYEKLNAEENTGPGEEVLYQWLGEAQYGQRKFELAIKAFSESIKRLESDASYDDAICGIMTAYVRIGDSFVKLGRLAEAEAAYKTALSKSDAAVAVKHADLPALLPIAAAHAGLSNLKLVSAARASAEQTGLRKQSCDESFHAQKFAKLIPVAFFFNPVNYPVIPLTDRPSQSCAKPTQP
jgi:eukaryotic-like serine/threonine-protein kinase